MTGLAATIAEIERLQSAADVGSVSIERRDDEDGSVDWIVHGRSGDVAACFETANRKAKQNAAYLAAVLNAAPALLAAAKRADTADDAIGILMQRHDAELHAAHEAGVAQCVARLHAAMRIMPERDTMQFAFREALKLIEAAPVNPYRPQATSAAKRAAELEAEVARLTRALEAERKPGMFDVG